MNAQKCTSCCMPRFGSNLNIDDITRQAQIGTTTDFRVILIILMNEFKLVDIYSNIDTFDFLVYMDSYIYNSSLLIIYCILIIYDSVRHYSIWMQCFQIDVHLDESYIDFRDLSLPPQLSLFLLATPLVSQAVWGHWLQACVYLPQPGWSGSLCIYIFVW